MNTNRIKWYDEGNLPTPDPVEESELFARLFDSIDRHKSDCLHDRCSSCHGTGKRNDGFGMCFHMISCPCPKCSPR